MIPAELDYAAPASVEEAVKLLDAHGEAKLLAGGMSLLPAVKHRMTQPSLLVDLARIPGLDAIAVRDGRVVLGALATHSAVLASEASKALPILRDTAGAIGDLQVRNRGTFAGSLVHADPAGDWPAVFLALEGEAELVGRKGARQVAAGDFFTGMLQSAVRADEVLVEVRLPLPPRHAGGAYVKLRQPASGFAIVGVAAHVELDSAQRIARARIGVAGVNPVPFRLATLEERLVGNVPDEATFRTLCGALPEADPMEDLHASAEYRRHLLQVFTRRALVRACQRAAA